MNYFDKRVVYYTILISKLLDENYEKILEKIAKVFQLNDATILNTILRNKLFQKLNSTTAIDMRINFANTSWGGENEFGKNKNEFDVLKVAHEAFSLLEELTKDVTKVEAVNTLMKQQKDKNNFSTLVALLLYVQGRYDNITISSLGKALKAGELDAGLTLLFFSEKTQHSILCTEITKIRDFFLYPEIEKMLVKDYSFDKDKLSNNLLKDKMI